MLFRRARAFGVVCFTIGLIFLFVGTVMPYYKSPQQLAGSGPGITFTESRPYWINSYFIPPIDAGQPISLTVLSNRQGATDVVLAFYDLSLQSIVGPPVVDVIFAPTQRGLAVFTKAYRSGPYFLTITSFNSTYTFNIASVWSPFYSLRALAIYSFLLIPLGMVVIYYDENAEHRERMIDDALRGIRKS